MVWTIIIIILSAADQLIKAIINHNLSTSDQIEVIDGFFYLVNRSNSGAAWSFLAGPKWGVYVLAAVSLLVTSMLLILLYRTRNIRLRLCLSIIISGSLGNLVDRIRLGAVTDYLDFHFGRYIFPTFNLADTLIVCGTILLCLLIIFDQTILDEIKIFGHHPAKPPGKEKTHAPDPADP
jgi:signal peptidase II